MTTTICTIALIGTALFCTVAVLIAVRSVLKPLRSVARVLCDLEDEQHEAARERRLTQL